MKTFPFQTLLMYALVFFAFHINAQQEHKEYHDNGNLKEEGQFDANGKGTGTWKYYFENGKLSHTGEVKNGFRSGAWKFYLKNNFIEDVHLFKDKKIVEPTEGCYFGSCENGYGMKYSPIGKIKTIGNFKNGKLHGKGCEIKSFSNYLITYEGDFVNGKKEGYGKDYHYLKGAYVGNWKAGEKHGKGKLIRSQSLGFNHTEYDGDWKADKKNGFGTEVKKHENGNEIEKYTGYWEKDLRNGEGKFFKKGRLIYEGNFVKDKFEKTKGCIDGDCETGYGVFIFPNKNKYIGEFKNGKKNGKGIEKDPDGNYIIGQWKNDKEDGLVKIFNSKNEIMFSGEMKNGKPIKAPQKHDVEIGCVLGDCANGFGHYKYQDGGTYIGEFKNENPHGQGTIHWANGGKYIGDFLNSQFDGYGRQYDADGNVVQEGMWVKGTCHVNFKVTLKKGKCVSGDCANGYGVQVIEKSGNFEKMMHLSTDYMEKYEGLWKDGKRCGFGYVKDAKGQTYVGGFDKLGSYEGKGVITIVERGIYYNGDFKDGSREGHGIMIFEDGSKYIGEWDSGERQGKGKEYDANGILVFEGKYNRNDREE